MDTDQPACSAHHMVANIMMVSSLELQFTSCWYQRHMLYLRNLISVFSLHSGRKYCPLIPIFSPSWVCGTCALDARFDYLGPPSPMTNNNKMLDWLTGGDGWVMWGGRWLDMITACCWAGTGDRGIGGENTSWRDAASHLYHPPPPGMCVHNRCLLATQNTFYSS